MQYLSNLAVVRWACGYFFGILVCLTQPKSKGRLHVNRTDPDGPLIIGEKTHPCLCFHSTLLHPHMFTSGFKFRLKICCLHVLHIG